MSQIPPTSEWRSNCSYASFMPFNARAADSPPGPAPTTHTALPHSIILSVYWSAMFTLPFYEITGFIVQTKTSRHGGQKDRQGAIPAKAAPRAAQQHRGRLGLAGIPRCPIQPPSPSGARLQSIHNAAEKNTSINPGDIVKTPATQPPSSRMRILAHHIAIAFAGGATLAAHAANDDIQKVVVTAQSRSQSAQDVPISMEVVTAKDIQNLGAKNLGDLNGYLPGLQVDATQATQPVFGIRGVQPGDFGIGTDTPVGIYVDSVYTGKTGGALMNFIDIQRVEVLKGPQGTLFGRNSAAGAISVVTNEPDDNFDMAGHIKVGNDNRVNMDAMLNLPLGKDTAARLVVVRAASDGWVRNTTTGTRTGGDNSWATRLSLKQNIKDATINLSWEHEQLRQHGWPAFGVIKDPALPQGGYTGVYDAAYIANFVDPRKAPLENDTDGRERRVFDGVTLRAELPLGGVTLRSTTAFRTFSSSNLTDNDGASRADFRLSTDDHKNAYNWQQEFKLSGKTDKLDWIAGVSFYDNQIGR